MRIPDGVKLVKMLPEPAKAGPLLEFSFRIQSFKPESSISKENCGILRKAIPSQPPGWLLDYIQRKRLPFENLIFPNTFI